MYKFLKLNPGSNHVRLVTTPYQYMAHEDYYLTGASEFAQRMPCVGYRGENTCKLCIDKAQPPRNRWLLGCIERTNGDFRLLDVPFGILQQLQNLARHHMWGNPESYDIDIFERSGMYEVSSVQVIPYPKQELSRADQELRACIDHKHLALMCNPSRKETLDAMQAESYIHKNELFRDL